MSNIKLKIKSKHLAAESKIIRKEELKLRQKVRYRIQRGKDNIERLQGDLWSLGYHRKNIVRQAARNTHLAYNFLRGNDYAVVENESTRTQPNWNEIERMALSYSTEDKRVTKQKFAEWKDAAQA